MPRPKTPFLEAVTELAKEHSVIAFVISAVLPIEDGFGISAGAASRLDEGAPENEEIMTAMEEAVGSAVEKLKTGSMTSSYLN